MKTKDGLFIEILEWAYGKQEVGFLEEDLIKEFSLRPEKIKWYLMVFKPNQSSDRMIEYVEGEHIYAITAKGISTILEYRGLKEAKESSRRAMRIATYSFWVAIAIGLLPIIMQFFTTEARI